MRSITVRVVNDDDDPVVGKRVAVWLTHELMPQTWLDDYTDDEGRAYFEFDYCLAVDIYVNGECQIEGVDDDGGEVTVSV